MRKYRISFCPHGWLSVVCKPCRIIERIEKPKKHKHKGSYVYEGNQRIKKCIICFKKI